MSVRIDKPRRRKFIPTVKHRRALNIINRADLCDPIAVDKNIRHINRTVRAEHFCALDDNFAAHNAVASQKFKYARCSSLSSSILTPIDSSLSSAIFLSISSGITYTFFSSLS